MSFNLAWYVGKRVHTYFGETIVRGWKDGFLVVDRPIVGLLIDDVWTAENQISRVFYGWQVLPTAITILDTSTHTTNAIILYPRICKKCKAPARKFRNTIMCSNNRCKSRKLFGKLYNNPIIKSQFNEQVLCLQCGNTANHTLPPFNNPVKTYCIAGHSWEHNWIVGQKVVQGDGSIFIATSINPIMFKKLTNG